jgi:GEVED domain/Secretion system C-terminal sorting domain/Fibronectin type III domain
MKQIFIITILFFQTILSFGQCNAPTNLTASYANNVSTFTWDAVPNATEYKIQFKYSVNDWTVIEYEETLTTNSVSYTGILQSSSYDWRVSTTCTSQTSTYTVAPTTFVVPCPAPNSLSTTQITSTSAVLNWVQAPGVSANVPHVIVAYREVNANFQPWIPMGSTTNSFFPLTGLQPNTTYEWCVNQSCPYFNSSPVISTFTTPPTPCGVATINLANNITTSQANVSWSGVPSASVYTVEYKPTSGTTWTTFNLGQTNYLITGLTASTSYDWRVKTSCGSNNVGNYSATGQFTTLAIPSASCGVPTEIYLSSLINGSATVRWAAVTGASGYTFSYKLSSSNVWIDVNTTTNSYTKNDYQLGSIYQYKVRTNCSGGSGNYSATGSFTTTNCIPTSNNSYEWIDLFKLGTINRTSGAETNGYINTGLSTNLTIGSSGNSCQISGGSTGNFRRQDIAIYIDFNRNGRYDDAGERVYGVGFLNNANTTSFNISIPSTATTGIAGMRVIMNKKGTGVFNVGCMSNFEGEVEDYTVNLVAPSSRIAADIDLESDMKLLAYPNPSTGIFQIELPQSVKADYYEVMNLSGTVILKNKVEENATIIEINLTKESTGMYILKVLDLEGRQFNQKLWKF